MALGAARAKLVTDAHENIYFGQRWGQSNVKAETMDLTNNAVGIRLVQQMSQGRHFLKTLKEMVAMMVKPCMQRMRRTLEGRHGGLVWYEGS